MRTSLRTSLGCQMSGVCPADKIFVCEGLERFGVVCPQFVRSCSPVAPFRTLNKVTPKLLKRQFSGDISRNGDHDEIRCFKKEVFRTYKKQKV